MNNNYSVNTKKENYEKNYNKEGNCQEKRIRF